MVCENIINLNSSIQYNHDDYMINPNHMMRLNNAIHLILGPHQDFSPLSASACIQKGESQLNQLRQLVSYPNLLSNFLADPSRTSNNSYKMLVLLQLSKMVPLTHEPIWWNLLQFYYSCTQKMEGIIIDMVVRHMVNINSHTSTYYQPFLSCIGPDRKWSMSHLSKMLHLVASVVHKLAQMAHRWQSQTPWVLQQIQFIVQTLQCALDSIQQIWHGYVQCITIYILRLLMIANSCSSSNQSQNVGFFVSSSLQALTKLKHISQSTKLAKLLLNLFNRFMGHSCLADQDLMEMIATILPSQLTIRYRKRSHQSEGFRVLIHLLLDSRQNIKLVQQCSHQILQVYHDHIINCEMKKHYTQILNDQRIDEAQQQQQAHNDMLIEYSEKYAIMSECLRLRQSYLNDCSIGKANINALVYLAYTNHTQANFQIIQIITMYFNSILNHFCLQNQDIIKCCLRYLFRFAVDNPSFNLIQICISVLNLRTALPHFHQYCDLLLHKAIPIVITCTQQDALWELAQVWIRNLQENYMDVRPYSYYPILLIMQSVDDNNFIALQINQQSKHKNEVNFPLLFQQLIQMLIEESKQQKNNAKIIKERLAENWCDNFQIFYKMCSILVKYLTASNRLNLKQKGKIKVDSQMMMVTQKVSEHIFKNELYSPDSAYIYVYHQVGKNQQQGIIEFLQNMMTQSFWRELDGNQILFFSCVIIGLTIHYSNLFSFDEIYQNYLQIIHNIQQSNNIELDTHRLKLQLADFCLLLQFSLPKQSCFN